jgi:putative ATP-binding cassette transporter
MVAVGAFNQVQASLRWFIDNFSIIADWRAILMRVAGFRRAVEDTESLTDAAGRIEIVRGAGRQIVLSGLSIASPSGSTRLRETEAAIPPGGRVMVLGEPGDGKTLLFRTLAGLWPLGAGRVTLPEGATILFIPRTPYVPPGRLAASLAYPNPPDRFTPQDCGAALAAVGLDHLVPRLDTAARWDKDLGEDERQALAFARLVLFRPDWAIVDEALDRLEDTTRSRVLDLLTGELRATGLVHIGRLAGQDALFDSVLHLEKVPEGALPPRPPRRHRR